MVSFYEMNGQISCDINQGVAHGEGPSPDAALREAIRDLYHGTGVLGACREGGFLDGEVNTR
jgi:hypothetical protein